jgi:hypothetical protein
MSRKEVVLLVSRTLALLLISWALADATSLPAEILAVSYSVVRGASLAESDYRARLAWLYLAGNVLRIAALLLGAALFWRPGRWVEALLLGSGKSEESDAGNP